MESTAVLRRFNRSYTQRIGALDESFLGLGLPLGSARLLFEIGAEEAPTVQRLRARLGLDSGYLSRLLRSLEEQDLVAVEPDPADRRRRLVRLTARGRRTRSKLDDRSEELAAAAGRAAERPAAGPAERGAGDCRPAGPGRHRRPRAGRPHRPRRPHGGGPLLRRAGPALRHRVRPRRGRRPRALPAAPRHVRGGPQRRRPGGLRRRPAARRAHRRDQADVGARRLARCRPGRPDAAAARGRRAGRRLRRGPPRHQLGADSRRSRCTSAPATAHIERYNDNPYARAWFEKGLRS